MTYQQLQFQGLPFRPDDKQVFYIEGTYDLQYNRLLELEYRRISDAFQRHCLQFCYLPKLFRTAGIEQKIRYYAPYLSENPPLSFLPETALLTIRQHSCSFRFRRFARIMLTLLSPSSAAYARLMKNGCLHISDSRLRQTVCSASQAILNLPKVMLAMNIMSLILGRGFGCVKRVGQSNAGWRKKSGNLRLNAVRNLPQDLPGKDLLNASWISFLLQRTKIFVDPLPLRKT